MKNNKREGRGGVGGFINFIFLKGVGGGSLLERGGLNRGFTVYLECYLEEKPLDRLVENLNEAK